MEHHGSGIRRVPRLNVENTGWNEKCQAIVDRGRTALKGRDEMLILLVVLVVLLLAAAPTWPYSRGWGYYPSGSLGTILVIVVVLMLLGYLHL